MRGRIYVFSIFVDVFGSALSFVKTFVSRSEWDKKNSVKSEIILSLTALNYLCSWEYLRPFSSIIYRWFVKRLLLQPQPWYFQKPTWLLVNDAPSMYNQKRQCFCVFWEIVFCCTLWKKTLSVIYFFFFSQVICTIY